MARAPKANCHQQTFLTIEGQKRVLRRFIQKQNLHVSVLESVKRPPSKGPPTDATPYMLVIMDIYIGLLFRGTMCPPIVRLPENMPDAPTPETARPMMKAVELGAVAHMMEPVSKSARAARKMILILKYVYSLP